jgi:hypothetical protein
MFDRKFLPSRSLRFGSAAALGIALAVSGGRPFPRRTSAHWAYPMGLHSLTSGGTSTGRLSPSVRLKSCRS